jgi:hypothetical protein
MNRMTRYENGGMRIVSRCNGFVLLSACPPYRPAPVPILYHAITFGSVGGGERVNVHPWAVAVQVEGMTSVVEVVLSRRKRSVPMCEVEGGGDLRLEDR